MDLIRKYFPQLDQEKIMLLERLLPLYEEWNQKINVISRKDMDNFFLHHVLHSLALAKVVQFTPGSKIMDVGTGGGFPGIPLAIVFPQCRFFLVDSIGKKIRVVQEVSQALQLKNVFAQKERAENVKESFDFIVSRAVTALPDFMKWVQHKTDLPSRNSIPNGVLYLKGGNIDDELKPLNHRYQIYEISRFFSESFFDTKKIVHLYKKQPD